MSNSLARGRMSPDPRDAGDVDQAAAPSGCTGRARRAGVCAGRRRPTSTGASLRRRRCLRARARSVEEEIRVMEPVLGSSPPCSPLTPSSLRLANLGSYSPIMRYTDKDVRRIVNYVAAFGVCVIPKIDMMATEPSTGQLNPRQPRDRHDGGRPVSPVHGHLPPRGADEVNTACWEDDLVVRRFLSKGGTPDNLLELFVNVTRPFVVHELNRTVVYWEDVLLGPKVMVRPTVLPKETTVLQTWNNGAENTKRIMAVGYRSIVSSAAYYYLDCGAWKKRGSTQARGWAVHGNGGGARQPAMGHRASGRSGPVPCCTSTSPGYHYMGISSVVGAACCMSTFALESRWCGTFLAIQLLY